MAGSLTVALALALVAPGALRGAEQEPPAAPVGPPASPLAPARAPVRQARPAMVVFSDGTRRSGQVWLTPGKRLKIFERVQEKYRELALADIVRIDVEPEKEVMEQVWRWKEHASDEKYYTGEAYPWREYVATLTVRDRTGRPKTVVGDVTALLYLQEEPKQGEPGKKPIRLIVHRRDKGEVGQSLQDLVYVAAVIFETDTGKEQR